MTTASGEGKRWFYVREGRRHGPVETTKLVDLVVAGEVPEDALVWHSGLPEWLPAREVEDIRRELPPPVPTPRDPPPPDPVPKEVGEGTGTAIPGEAVAGEGAEDPDAPAGPESEGSENGQKRRRKRKHRHRASKRRPAWLWPLVVVLVGLMIFLWWLLRRMNEVPPGRIIQTGSLATRPSAEEPRLGSPGPVPYRAELGREPRVSSRVTSCPPRFTTTATLSPGFASPSA
jgi:GYF domain 2